MLTVALLFSLGTALVGAIHQAIWLSTSRSALSLDASIDPLRRGFIEITRQDSMRSKRNENMRQFSAGFQNVQSDTAGRNHKPWGYPANVRDSGEGLNHIPTGFGDPSGQRSAHFVMADGSVREINDKADRRILKALVTPNGGETLVHEKGQRIETAP